MIGLRVNLRVDGMINIEGANIMPRLFATHAEADAFIAGFRAAHDAVRDLVREREIVDTRPHRPAPRADT